MDCPKEYIILVLRNGRVGFQPSDGLQKLWRHPRPLLIHILNIWLGAFNRLYFPPAVTARKPPLFNYTSSLIYIIQERDLPESVHKRWICWRSRYFLIRFKVIAAIYFFIFIHNVISLSQWWMNLHTTVRDAILLLLKNKSD